MMQYKALFTSFFVILFIQAFTQNFNYLPISTTGQIIKHQFYTLSYSEDHEQAEWVAYELTKKEVFGTFQRTNDFRPDPLVKTQSAQLSDYKGSGYDRGHLAPAGDMKMNHTSMSESFFMSNMSPQTPSFNRGIWLQLEKQVRAWAVWDESIYVVTGGVFKDFLGQIGTNHVMIPGSFYKVIIDYREPWIKAIAFVLPNEKGTKQLIEYVVTIDYVESITGIDFFPALPDSLENILESTKDVSKWFFEPIKSTTSVKSTSSGVKSTAVQCKGIAKSTGVRCKNKTKNVPGYCHYHVGQDPNNKTSNPVKSSTAVQCSGTTKAGNRCKRKTTNSNGRCYQH